AVEQPFRVILNCTDSIVTFAMNGRLPLRMWSVSTNAASTQLDVAVDRSSDATVQYMLDDLLGRTVRAGVLRDESLSIDISQLPSGPYFLRLTQSGFSAL